MTVSVQMFGGEAAEILSEMQARSFQDTPEQLWSGKEFAALFQHSGTKAMILSVAAETAGFLMWRQVADEAEILTIAVLPACRGRGLGQRLLEEFYEQARVAGVRDIFLEVRADNKAAESLYAKAGFDRVGRRKNYYGGRGAEKQDALIMKYSLDPHSACKI
ncbi:MAG: ribosomal protein S18-alanine N-acetyltransferase [Emcibacter sp.]|nr:ribosomal protein S18-alanine N-acetyltransferase [Emcibacter sp.]